MIELLLLLVAFGLMLIAALIVIINYVLMGDFHTMAFWLAFLAVVCLCIKFAYNDLKKFKL
jgi:hypothetical protein